MREPRWTAALPRTVFGRPQDGIEGR
jgi:hypothetical protein